MARQIIPIPDLSDADVRRFQKYLRRVKETGCLEWVGARGSKGYGRFAVGGRHSRGGRVFQSHRIAFVMAGGLLTAERPFVLHNCPVGDNPACCEFTHLWAGTVLDNARDMARKRRGRSSRLGLPYGVVRAHGSNHFQARAYSDGKTIILGTYGTAEDAASVAETARRLRVEWHEGGPQ